MLCFVFVCLFLYFVLFSCLHEWETFTTNETELKIAASDSTKNVFIGCNIYFKMFQTKYNMLRFYFRKHTHTHTQKSRYEGDKRTLSTARMFSSPFRLGEQLTDCWSKQANNHMEEVPMVSQEHKNEEARRTVTSFAASIYIRCH